MTIYSAAGFAMEAQQVLKTPYSMQSEDLANENEKRSGVSPTAMSSASRGAYLG